MKAKIFLLLSVVNLVAPALFAVPRYTEPTIAESFVSLGGSAANVARSLGNVGKSLGSVVMSVGKVGGSVCGLGKSLVRGAGSGICNTTKKAFSLPARWTPALVKGSCNRGLVALSCVGAVYAYSNLLGQEIDLKILCDYIENYGASAACLVFPCYWLKHTFSNASDIVQGNRESSLKDARLVVEKFRKNEEACLLEKLVSLANDLAPYVIASTTKFNRQRFSSILNDGDVELYTQLCNIFSDITDLIGLSKNGVSCQALVNSNLFKQLYTGVKSVAESVEAKHKTLSSLEELGRRSRDVGFHLFLDTPAKSSSFIRFIKGLRAGSFGYSDLLEDCSSINWSEFSNADLDDYLGDLCSSERLNDSTICCLSLLASFDGQIKQELNKFAASKAGLLDLRDSVGKAVSADFNVEENHRAVLNANKTYNQAKDSLDKAVVSFVSCPDFSKSILPELKDKLLFLVFNNKNVRLSFASDLGGLHDQYTEVCVFGDILDFRKIFVWNEAPYILLVKVLSEGLSGLDNFKKAFEYTSDPKKLQEYLKAEQILNDAGEIKKCDLLDLEKIDEKAVQEDANEIDNVVEASFFEKARGATRPLAYLATMCGKSAKFVWPLASMCAGQVKKIAFRGVNIPASKKGFSPDVAGTVHQVSQEALLTHGAPALTLPMPPSTANALKSGEEPEQS